MKYILTAVIVSALLAPVVALLTTTGVVQEQIVPGQAIGPFRVGMPLDQATELARKLGEVEVTEGVACNTQENVGVCVYDHFVYGDDAEPTRTPGQVLLVVTDDPRYRFGGAGVGSAFTDFLRALGNPNPEWFGGRWLEWTSRGVMVALVTRQGQVVVGAVAVFKPRP
jgi:hypothetical protein